MSGSSLIIINYDFFWYIIYIIEEKKSMESCFIIQNFSYQLMQKCHCVKGSPVKRRKKKAKLNTWKAITITQLLKEVI